MLSYRYFILFIFCLSGLSSCIDFGLDQVEPNSLRVSQGSSAINQSSVIDFGTLRSNQSVSKSFTVSNTASSPMNISSITSDNGDFIVELEQDSSAVEPRQAVRFKVTYLPQLGGVSVGKISFLTSDPAFPIFSFRVRGQGLFAPEIIANGSPLFDELNTVDFGDNGFGTRFQLEIFVEDPSQQIDPDDFILVINAVFESGEEVSLEKLSNEVEINADGKRMNFSSGILFGESNYVDISVTIRLPSGETSNTYTFRIERPEGAN